MLFNLISSVLQQRKSQGSKVNKPSSKSWIVLYRLPSATLGYRRLLASLHRHFYIHPHLPPQSSSSCPLACLDSRNRDRPASVQRHSPLANGFASLVHIAVLRSAVQTFSLRIVGSGFGTQLGIVTVHLTLREQRPV